MIQRNLTPIVRRIFDLIPDDFEEKANISLRLSLLNGKIHTSSIGIIQQSLGPINEPWQEAILSILNEEFLGVTRKDGWRIDGF